jgi:hypothetical protein
MATIDRYKIEDDSGRLILPEPENTIIFGFACLHKMFWGKVDSLSQIKKRRSIEVPQFSMEVELSLNDPQQPISTNIYDHYVIDIKESDFFKGHASGLEDFQTKLLPCSKTEILLLDYYPMLYEMVMKRDIDSIGSIEENRAHSTISGQPGIGRFLILFYTG